MLAVFTRCNGLSHHLISLQALLICALLCCTPSSKPSESIAAMQFYEDNCLLEQRYVKDDSKKVFEVLKEAGMAIGADLEIQDYVRLQCGEGLDKEQSSFADDVAQALQQTG